MCVVVPFDHHLSVPSLYSPLCATFVSCLFIGTRSSEPTMEGLMNDVAAVVPAKWRFVGIQLKVPQRDLDDIQSQMAGRPNSNLHAFEVMLAKWSTLDPYQYTWSTIIGALETPSVGEVALAAELRTKYLC